MGFWKIATEFVGIADSYATTSNLGGYLRQHEGHLLRLAQVWEELVQLEQRLVCLEVVCSRFHLQKRKHKSESTQVYLLNNSMILRTNLESAPGSIDSRVRPTIYGVVYSLGSKPETIVS